jgi:hypothetical protein
MTAFFYDQFSTHPTVRTITQRLGLVGFARLVLILEECTDAGQVSMSRRDWLATLQCSAVEFDELLGVLDQVGAFRSSQLPGELAPLMLSMAQSLQFLLVKPDPATVVLTTAAQWADWMAVELAAPGWLTSDPASQELFRRWCASNVTLGEMSQAAELAALVPDLTPNGLHAKWKEVRATRVAHAYNRAP